jgi:hypothetical protein
VDVLDVEALDGRALAHGDVAWATPRAGKGSARVALVADLSAATLPALHWAERLAGEGAAIDVFFLWSAPGDVTSADRVAAELKLLSSEEGAIDVLDRIGDLHRRGVLTVRGCVTREGSGASSLSALATRAGYRLVLQGLRRAPDGAHRFRLDTFERAP